jgi:DNA-binding CsgD family transcriptional regulator
MRSLDPIAKQIGAFAEAAASAGGRAELREQICAHLIRSLRLDAGVIWTVPESLDAATTFGCSARSIWERYFNNRERYAADLLPLFQAVSREGVVNQRRFGRRMFERLDFYGEIVRPLGAHSVLTAMLGVRGRGLAIMQVARTGRTPEFGDRDAAFLKQMLPVLSLGEALHDESRPAPPLIASAEALSARERDIVSYVALGFTNRQIALALGTSPHTVHSQMKNIFRKMDVSTRAELVGRTVGPGQPSGA